MQLSQIQPVADRVVIRRDNMPQKTKEGIFIPIAAKNTKRTATVLKAGPLSTLKAGDRVFFLAQNGLEMITDEGKVILLPELSILAEVNSTEI